jgi:hypothetical protein
MLCSGKYFELWVAANFVDARSVAWLMAWHVCAFFTFVYVSRELQPRLMNIWRVTTTIMGLRPATIVLGAKGMFALASASCFACSVVAAILIGYCVKLRT